MKRKAGLAVGCALVALSLAACSSSGKQSASTQHQSQPQVSDSRSQPTHMGQHSGQQHSSAYDRPRGAGQHGSMALGRTDVRNLQTALNDKGYNAGAADGIMGQRTRGALESFQRDNNMGVTGRPDHGTLAALGVTATGARDHASRQSAMRSTNEGQRAGTASDGSRSYTPMAQREPTQRLDGQLSRSEIRGVQQTLKDNGYDLAVDGQWGPGSMAALKKYQAEQNLPVTGRPDTNTMAALKKTAEQTAENPANRTTTPGVTGPGAGTSGTANPNAMPNVAPNAERNPDGTLKTPQQEGRGAWERLKDGTVETYDKAKEGTKDAIDSLDRATTPDNKVD